MNITQGYNTRDIDGFVRGIGGIGTMLAKQPILNAQAGMLQYRRGLYQAQTSREQAHGDLYHSQAALLAQKLADLKVSAADREELLKAAQDAAPFVQSGKMDAPEVARFSGIVTKVAAQNSGHPAVEYLTSLGLPQPNNVYAADTRLKLGDKLNATRLQIADKNAETRLKGGDAVNATRVKIGDAINATRLQIADKNKFRNGGPGSAIYNQQTGEIIGYVPSAAGSETTRTKIPGTVATPAKTHFFAPNEPAVPAGPEVTHTVRQPLGRAVVSPLQIGAAPTRTVSAPASAPVANPMVGVPVEPSAGNAVTGAAVAPVKWTPPPIRTQADADAILAEAQRAIASGKDPNIIHDRLTQMGFQLNTNVPDQSGQ